MSCLRALVCLLFLRENSHASNRPICTTLDSANFLSFSLTSHCGSAWIPNTDLTPLKVEDVQNFSEKSKTKSLILAYQKAAEQQDLAHFKDLLVEHQKALQEDFETREAKAQAAEAKKAKKAEKGSKSKSKATAEDEDEEMEDVGSDEPVTKPKSSKKRKKADDSDGETEKVRYLYPACD